MEEHIVNYFKEKLIKRSLVGFENLLPNDYFILTNIGLPNKILDFDFSKSLYTKSDTKLVIGETLWNENIILDILSRKIVREADDCFLANSIENFITQLYIYDYLWKEMIPNAELGNYRDNKNHKKYAKWLEDKWLEVDPDLINDDSCYFWGALIEDIEFGIVG